MARAELDSLAETIDAADLDALEAIVPELGSFLAALKPGDGDGAETVTIKGRLSVLRGKNSTHLIRVSDDPAQQGGAA